MKQLPAKIYTGKWQGGHIQGIAIDRERKYIYCSFITEFVKLDMEGNLIGSVRGFTGHLGCMAYNYDDGRVYASLEYKNDGIGQGILKHLGIQGKVKDAFYIAIFDVEKITRLDMDAQRDGVVTTVWLREVLEDYQAEWEEEGAIKKHRYGCSGIDGMTFAPAFEGEGMRLLVAYGIYGDINRNDNDYQVLLSYTPEKLRRYESILTTENIHSNGPKACEEKYFVYTGNTRFGIQNLEYDSFTGDIFAAVYKGQKSEYPNYDMFVIKGKQHPMIQTLRGCYEEACKVLELKEIGLSEGGMYGYRFPYGMTGMCSLGDGRFYFSENHDTDDGHESNICLYRYTGEDPVGFVKMFQEQVCKCGMNHSCDIRRVIIAPGAVRELKNVLGNYKKILLVADTNTYAVCGHAVEAQLDARMENLLVYVRQGILVPNEEAVSQMQQMVTEETDLIIGIGSGVIQDLCKYVSFEAGLPYYIIATAPSMDGYASKGAAMIAGNMKVTYNAHVPEVIIGDVDILKEAPMDMIRSGYGDILGKYSCLNDWKLSKTILDEYFCQYVYDLTYEMLLKTKDLGELLQKRDPGAVQTLMEALVGVGIAMAYVGNSRPASGSEHHMSHFFEVTGILNDEKYFMHGIDVAYSTVYTQRLREDLLEMKYPVVKEKLCKEEWIEKIRSVYTDAADGVIALQKKLGWYERNLQPVYESKWAKIQEVLREVPSSEELIRYLDSVGLDIKEFEKMYGEEKIHDALWFAKDLKDRYSVLWMYYDLMM